MLRGKRMICRHLVWMNKDRHMEGEKDSAKEIEGAKTE